ncbi:MAG: hypothetical protein N2578_08360, partial [Bdellovibrionaceae bacterium]|nr:hypothetical protein [Pseudobdellovibrionaceae bacterium]
ALLSDIRVNDYKKVDILIVIDNSGSMQYEQQSMASRVRNLMRVIRGLDYQIAVTTTDPRDIPLGDGRFIPIWGTQNQFIIDPSTPEEVAQERLGKTLQRPETGYGLEQPIRVVYRAIERSRDGRNPVHAQFFRQDAQFAVLVISDEDESDNTPKNDPENLIALVNNVFNGQKRFSFHSIITRPGDVACRSTHGAAYGERLARMSELTGGIIGSVCETDYGAQLSGIGEGIRNLLKTLTLQCQPLTQCPITIKRNGVVQSSLNFVVEGVNLRFATELEPGDYQVSYRCLR